MGFVTSVLVFMTCMMALMALVATVMMFAHAFTGAGSRFNPRSFHSEYTAGIATCVTWLS